MKKKTVYGLILSSLALAVASCSSNCKDNGTCECVTRYDCKTDFFCLDGVCVEENKKEWIIPERNFGEKCISHRECVDGICLPLGPDNGGICTRECASHETCGDGYVCKTWTGDGLYLNTGRVCVQETASRLCSTCAVDGHCNAIGDLCLESKDGRICAADCAIDPCPTGYTCETVMRDGKAFAQCLPIDNTCECGAGKEGMGRVCSQTNSYGTCVGREYCTKTDSGYEWSACDARVPQAEICNGIDDDCDGLIDAADPDITVDSETDEIGAKYPICYEGGCVGRWVCAANEHNVYYWYCDATAPEREICNGVDDNCDGRVDEPFVDENGVYIHVDHCGACGASCANILAHLKKDAEGNVVENAVSCQIRNEQPTCVPHLCEDGYYPYPNDSPVSCVKLESPACQVCVDDADCRVYTDVCRALDGDYGKHCLQSCDENSPYPKCSGLVDVKSCCPDGYVCRNYEGEKRCIPQGDSCSCDKSKVGMTRNCVVSSDTGVCQGRQTCEKNGEKSYGWSDCSTSGLTQELCDGQDNDCDGEVDEDFKDAEGRYNHPAHCGACHADCESRWKAPELHAEGACLLTQGAAAYSCQFTGCKLEDLAAGKRCQVDSDCVSGQRCDKQFYYCVAESGDTPAPSCAADSDCASLSSAHRCLDGVCKIRVQFYDVNQIDVDGCECGVAVDGGGDQPDLFNRYPDASSPYIDRDCDGIDGSEKTSLFVNGSSKVSQGTREHPYATISEALRHYDVRKHTAILVAAGTYLEQVVLFSGVKLYGGYSSDFRSRNIVLNPTQIVSPPPSDSGKPGSVYIPEVARQTILSGFVVAGYDSDESEVLSNRAGRNTYAIYIEKAQSQLIIANNTIIGGRAGDGANGATGASGYVGGDGFDGQNSFECHTPYCENLSGKGGKAGENSHCPVAAGRPGLNALGGYGVTQYNSYESSLSRDGKGGDNNSYQSSQPQHMDYCKYDCMSGGYANGGDAKNGTSGMHGVSGVSCSDSRGRVVDGVWMGNTASSGGAGREGTGGGGGGAGGNSPNLNNKPCTQGRLVGDVGGSGGGGGAGGCGGQGGYYGGSGGGSFAVWIAAMESLPKIYGNVIRLGKGGNGGNGGSGGAGGNGGKGGVGGVNETPAWCAGAGGAGGTGGKGGSGGGGGAGCGGISAGIAGIGALESLESQNIFRFPETDDVAFAKGGSGGDAPGTTDSAKNGADGASFAVVHF